MRTTHIIALSSQALALGLYFLGILPLNWLAGTGGFNLCFVILTDYLCFPSSSFPLSIRRTVWHHPGKGKVTEILGPNKDALAQWIQNELKHRNLKPGDEVVVTLDFKKNSIPEAPPSFITDCVRNTNV